MGYLVTKTCCAVADCNYSSTLIGMTNNLTGNQYLSNNLVIKKVKLSC